MRSVFAFVRATVVGGILFLLPFGLVLLVLGRLFVFAEPIASAIHHRLYPWARTALGPSLLAILMLVVLAFVAGVLARSRVGRSIFTRTELLIQARLPAYMLVRQTIADMAGGAEHLSRAAATKVVLVRLDDQTSIAFLVERRPTGDVVVFFPDAPSGTSGSVALVEADRITETSLTPKDVLVAMRRLGAGLFDLQTKDNRT